MKTLQLTPCTPMLDEDFKLSLLRALSDLAQAVWQRFFHVIDATAFDLPLGAI